MQSIRLSDVLARVIQIHELTDPAVPAALFSAPQDTGVPFIQEIRYPLPSAKHSYTCFAKTKRAVWMGADNGLTRYEEAPQHEADRVMFFPAERNLADNCVKALYVPDENREEIWALTQTAVAHIILRTLSGEEKAEILTEETLSYVDRHGMVSQKDLTEPRKPASAVPHGHSDNSGTFTAGFAVGELCKYAYYKRTLGPAHEKTVRARASAVRNTEATLLLMYMPCRGNGFVARTYLTPNEPLPDDGLFYRIENGKAVCLDTSQARERGIAGKEIYAGGTIPQRLRHLFEDEGYTLDGLRYKGDTSSDEITHHFLLAYFTHMILGEEDKELDALMITAVKNTLQHIIDNGNRLIECDGEPTTWAKWDKGYFSELLGWSDGCLNAAELLMYHKVVMAISGETGKWKENYDRLVNAEGYAHLTTLHDSRFHISADVSGLEQVEELMYGDNMLATCAYWLLITLEEDEKLKETYRAGYRGWNGTFRREHNPIYDIPYMLSCPDDPVDTQMLADWFRRQDISRVCGSVSIEERRDVPVRYRFGGTKETSWLLMPDERGISKYDRNPYAFISAHNENGTQVLESCYVYTCAYWLGKYYGVIEED